MRRVLFAAVAALALQAAPASAAIHTIYFSVSSDAWVQELGTESPFGLPNSPSFSGNWSFDDATHFTVDKSGQEVYPDIVAFNLHLGTQNWTLDDAKAPGTYAQAMLPGDPFYFWDLAFLTPKGPGGLQNYISATQVQLDDTLNSISCNDCVTWSISDGLPGGGGVPEPATWAMMIAGFGLIGLALRRRPLAA